MRPVFGMRPGRSPTAAPRCTYSPATRPRLSHAPRSVASIQAASWSGIRGAQIGAADAMRRQQRPNRRARSRRTDRPRDPGRCGAAACSSHLTIRPRMRSPYSDKLPPHSEFDQQLAEHVAALQPGQRRRGNPPADTPCRSPAVTPAAMRSSARASGRQRRAERADDAVLLLEQLHQVDAARPARRSRRTSPAARRASARTANPAQVSAPVCSNTTSTPLRAVSLRTTPSNRSSR